MQARIDWVLIVFGTQVIKRKRPARAFFLDYFSVSYDYVLTDTVLRKPNLGNISLKKTVPDTSKHISCRLASFLS